LLLRLYCYNTRLPVYIYRYIAVAGLVPSAIDRIFSRSLIFASLKTDASRTFGSTADGGSSIRERVVGVGWEREVKDFSGAFFFINIPVLLLTRLYRRRDNEKRQLCRLGIITYIIISSHSQRNYNNMYILQLR